MEVANLDVHLYLILKRSVGAGSLSVAIGKLVFVAPTPVQWTLQAQMVKVYLCIKRLERLYL